MPQMNMVMAVNEALRSAMRRDKRVVVMGEDVGKVGGVFRVTAGLQEEFGETRVIDTPLSENGIVGCAVGMALYGMVPVVEIQFADFIWPAYDQIVNDTRFVLSIFLPFIFAASLFVLAVGKERVVAVFGRRLPFSQFFAGLLLALAAIDVLYNAARVFI